MSLYVVIRKIMDTNFSEYAFSTDEDRLGLLKIDKVTGDVMHIEPAQVTTRALCTREPCIR